LRYIAQLTFPFMRLNQVRATVAMMRVWAWPLVLPLAACTVQPKEGVFACQTSDACPPGQYCAVEKQLCFKSTAKLADEPGEPGGASGKAETGGAGASGRANEAGAGAGGRTPIAGGGGVAGKDPPPKGGQSGSTSGGHSGSPVAGSSGRRAAGSGGAGAAGSGGAGGSGGASGRPVGGAGAGGGVTAGAGGDPTACPQSGFCYGFEAGVLDPMGALWASPTASNGGLPPLGQLSTREYPAASGNHVFVSVPNRNDDWPKATIGLTPNMPFSKLAIAFEFAADTALYQPIHEVALFRFVAVPGAAAVDLFMRDNAVGIAITNEPASIDTGDLFAAGVPANQPVHIQLVFTRSASECTVTASYGETQKTLPMYCDLADYNLEFGLNLQVPSTQYSEQYTAFYDDLRVVVTAP
jgi:hypothetical protein